MFEILEVPFGYFFSIDIFHSSNRLLGDNVCGQLRHASASTGPRCSDSHSDTFLIGKNSKTE